MTVLDIGAGKRCVFAEYLPSGTDVRIIGLDVGATDLLANRDLNSRVLANAERLPFSDNSVDMIVSHSVLEHIPRIDVFFAEASRVLKPGGHFIHFLPSRYALFAMINRAIPAKLSKRLLFALRPESAEHAGFVTHYDECYNSALRRQLARHGFSHDSVRVGYCQSAYFGFFIPLFLLAAAYDLLVRALGVRNLAAQILINARKVSQDL